MIRKKLTVAVVTAPHVLQVKRFVDEEIQLTGFDGAYLQMVLSALDVDYEIVEPSDGEWGRKLPGGNWTGLVGMIQRGEADLTLGSVAFTSGRKQVVDMSTPCTVYGETFVIVHPGHDISNIAYLHALDTYSWICNFSILLIIPILFFIIVHRKISFGDMFLGALGSILKQPTIVNKMFPNWKWLLCVWLSFVTVICFCYTAGLSAILTVRIPKDTIKTFHQLALAVKERTHRVYITKGNFIAEYLELSNEDHLRIIGEEIIRNEWYFSIQDSGSGKYVNQYSVELEVRPQLELFYGNQAVMKKYIISDDNVGTTPFGFLISSNFSFKSKLNSIISRAASAGLYDKFFKASSLKAGLSSEIETPENERRHQLSMQALSGTFMLLCVGMSCSFIALLFELLYYNLYYRIRINVNK
ncbi:glutamate receptor ionotropic, kainate glr-3-like [Argiope bruennichi]|uniref:Glutamate receptor ionotropic like protein n=1 Tax=Argiope bruennichi TaxID=94029 RepID=A0A8T0E0S1_ARGBR|nr:glutamate receptor ionotropic, kainate glr-3-like [Argiope bruennichi]KAF8763829.1 Glutamate receptor ionotropic like protein [Argiope bruennichi]